MEMVAVVYIRPMCASLKLAEGGGIKDLEILFAVPRLDVRATEMLRLLEDSLCRSRKWPEKPGEIYGACIAPESVALCYLVDQYRLRQSINVEAYYEAEVLEVRQRDYQ